MMAQTGENPRVAQVCVGLPRRVEDAHGVWRSGIFKSPVAGAVWLGRTGFEGDGQATPVVHGGPDKALLLYALAHYPHWRQEFDKDSFTPGGFGENLTVEGLDETTVCLGDVWAVGQARVQVCQPREPCWKLARRHGLPGLIKRVNQTGRSGWYCRVLKEGMVGAGDTLTLQNRPHAGWTVHRAAKAKANAARHRREVLTLVAMPELASLWRATLVKRLAIGPFDEEA